MKTLQVFVCVHLYIFASENANHRPKTIRLQSTSSSNAVSLYFEYHFKFEKTVFKILRHGGKKTIRINT